MHDLTRYRASALELARTADLLRILPSGRESVLDIGARDGHFSKLLTEHFPQVTALDLEKPSFEIPGVETVAGDVTRLAFPDNHFDCAFCAEVLEHIPNLAQACREIVRVAKHEIVIGVPFEQEIRLGRSTCHACGKANPPWGHVNSFSERKLLELFSGTSLVSKSFVGTQRHATNPVSILLMDWAGNPVGTYSQEEPCIHCGAKLKPVEHLSVWGKLCLNAGMALNRVQSALTPERGNWIHLVFSKSAAAGR